jgi:hypothetical protein
VSNDEVTAVLGELEQLMSQLRGNVTALQAILTDAAPEVPGDQPAPAA